MVCSMKPVSVPCTSVKLCFRGCEWSCAWFPFFPHQSSIIDTVPTSFLPIFSPSFSASECRVHNLLFRSFRHWLQPTECVNPCKPKRYTRLGACSSWTGSHK